MDNPNSIYLEAFNRASKYFTLAGNRMLVERMDDVEVKTAGGLYLAPASNKRSDLKLQKPLVCVVLATGEGYTQEGSEEKLPLDCKPGNVVILNAIGASFFSILPGMSSYTEERVGLTSESDVQMRFNSIEHFQEYTKALNG